MLVLTRKKGERVMIGDDIVITVIDVRGDGVRIGFDAPRGVSIQRAEVVAAVEEANAGAAASAAKGPDLLLGLLTKARRQDAPAASEEATAPVREADAAPAAPRAARATLPAGLPKPTPPKPRA
ncbi:carbon storage regulator CsrA [uncultured Amnibacterium sp.]|uniref:carbon storage regulator CsrA n=1 Tax=uncultured Amnibacterium sp. TaxID=1631851 RepID=UPI0035C9DDB3